MNLANRLKEEAQACVAAPTEEHINETSSAIIAQNNIDKSIAIAKPVNNQNSSCISKDFSKFESNNWIRTDKEVSPLISQMKSRGAAFWLDHGGDFYFRRSESDEIKKLDPAKAKNVICSILDREDINIFKASKNENVDIKRNDILMCNDKFSPFVESEFYLEKGLWYRTSFRPSVYLQINRNKSSSLPEPSRILWLLLHLCNGNEEYFGWLVNWLAYFFQTLEKSQVALVLKGDQGTGKGLLFEKIISELFGKKFCVVVDDDRLGSTFKNWIGENLFCNLNEISHDMKGRKNTKNFIKMLVTDESVQTEKKFENASETEIFSNVIVTSNENFPIEIEPSDRRFTVFNTGASLKKVGVNTARLIQDIRNELESFAIYLKNYDCDVSMYHQALDTPEKTALIEGTTDRFTLFTRAIVNRDISFFEVISDENSSLFNILKDDFEEGRINQSNIVRVYEIVYDDDISSKTLMKKIRDIQPLIFPKERKKMISSNGVKYFKLPLN